MENVNKSRCSEVKVMRGDEMFHKDLKRSILNSNRKIHRLDLMVGMLNRISKWQFLFLQLLHNILRSTVNNGNITVHVYVIHQSFTAKIHKII